MPTDDGKNQEPAKNTGDQGDQGKDPKGEPTGDPQTDPKTDPPKKADGDGPEPSGGGDKDLAAQLADANKRAKEAEAKIDKLEKESLEKAGDVKGLLAKEQKKVLKLTEELKETKSKALKHKVSVEFSKHAPDAQNLELLTKLDEVKKAVTLDHDSLEISGVKEAVNAARKSHPYLFKQKSAGWGNGVPIDNSNGDDTEVGAFVVAMRKARTSQEKHQVRKQFNRQL